MLETTAEIINKAGLHARAAAKLVALTSTYNCRIRIGQDKLVDGKSILSLMMLAAVKGTTVKIVAEGEDEQIALDAIVELINNRFDEKE